MDLVIWLWSAGLLLYICAIVFWLQALWLRGASHKAYMSAEETRFKTLTNVPFMAQFSHYFSTYCIDGIHDDCRKTCKNCGKPCRCACHKVLPKS